MKTFLTAALASTAILASAGIGSAGCGIAKGSVRILSNDFEALHIVADRAAECAGDGVEVTKNQTTEHKNIQVAALTTNPATYTVPVIATNSIVALLNAGLIRPLDDLVAKYGQDLQPSQKIVIDGKVMAIAFMANSQNLYYRKDLLEKAGLSVPKTYEEMIADGKTLRDKGLIQTPLAANFKPGWDLGSEFVNMYLGTGADFFEPGSAAPAIDNANGIKALDTMKAMADLMSPDFVTYDTNAVKPVWEANEAAMMNGWGSRAGAFIDPAEGHPDIASETDFAATPTIGDGTVPATALWWDGFSIAKNISDEDADASFQAMMHAISPDLLKDPKNQAAAVWLVKGYEPSPAAKGVVANMQAGARPYPMLPYMTLLHTALGDNLGEFMQGQESAEQALKDTTAAYTTAAKEAGFIQ